MMESIFIIIVVCFIIYVVHDLKKKWINTMLIFLKKEDGIVEQKKEQNLLMNMTGTHLEKKKRNDKVLVGNKDMLCSCTILFTSIRK